MSLNVFLWAPCQRGGLFGGSASEMASVRTLGSQGQLHSAPLLTSPLCAPFSVRWVRVGRKHIKGSEILLKEYPSIYHTLTFYFLSSCYLWMLLVVMLFDHIGNLSVARSDVCLV